MLCEICCKRKKKTSLLTMWAKKKRKKSWTEPQINTYFYRIYVKEKMPRVCVLFFLVVGSNPVSNRFMPSSKAIFMHACTLRCDEGRRRACFEAQKKEKCLCNFAFFSYIMCVCSCCAAFFFLLWIRPFKS